MNSIQNPPHLYASDGVGALQISAYSKHKEITEKDLTEFISEEVPEGEELKKFSLGEYVGLQTDYKYTDHYWRIWLLKKANIMLYITYNCEFDDKNIETKVINQIISSLR